METSRIHELGGLQMEAERKMAQGAEGREKAIVMAWERCLDALLINRERVAGVALILVSKPGTVFINPASGDPGGGPELVRFLSMSGAESPEAEVMLTVQAGKLQDTIGAALGL